MWILCHGGLRLRCGQYDREGAVESFCCGQGSFKMTQRCKGTFEAFPGIVLVVYNSTRMLKDAVRGCGICLSLDLLPRTSLPLLQSQEKGKIGLVEGCFLEIQVYSSNAGYRLA